MPSGHKYCHDFALWLLASPDFVIAVPGTTEYDSTQMKWAPRAALSEQRDTDVAPSLTLQPGNNSRRAQTSRAGGNVPDPYSPTCQVLTWAFGGLGCKWLPQPTGLVYTSPGGYFVRKPG